MVGLLPPISNWHVLISGFTQEQSRLNGIVALWLKMRAACADSRSEVAYREWDADWKKTAELIWLTRPDYPQKVNIYAYSWGAGYGAMELARHLNDRGIEVQQMVLADPVYRSRTLLFRWLALVPWCSILVPPNVRSVASFFQRQNVPAAHELRRTSDRTIVHPRVELHCKHEFADDSEAFHQECLRVALLTSES